MLDHRYIQTNLFSNDDHLIQEGSRPFHSWPHFVPHLVLFFTFHSLTLNYTFILYLFIVCFCLWNVSSTRAGTRLFVLSPAVFPAPTMVLSIELGPINISEQIEDKPLLCADAFFFFLHYCNWCYHCSATEEIEMEGNKCTCLKFQILKAAEPKLKLESVFPPNKRLSSPQSNYENFAFMGKKTRLSQLN